MVDRDVLDSLSNKIDDLPMLPQVLVKILQIKTTDDDYFDQVEKLASEDPPFSVRLIGLANSASIAAAAPAKSIRIALARVGAETLTNLVAALAVQRVFVPTQPSQAALWDHSIRVAVCAEIIAKRSPDAKVDAGDAYLSGLLHDIGRFVMFEHVPERLLEVDESNWHTPEELVSSEVEIFKFTHSELGYLACRRWSLPDEIAEIVRRHHDDLDDGVKPGSMEANVSCVAIADHVALLLEHEDTDLDDAEEWAKLIERRYAALHAPPFFLAPESLAREVRNITEQTHQLLSGLRMSQPS